MASIRKRTWEYKGVEKTAWVLDYIDGQGKRRQVTFDKKKDADKHRQVIEQQISEGRHTPKSLGTMSLAVVADEWLRDCDRRRHINDGISGYTMRSYRTLTEIYVKPNFGGMKITEVTADQLQRHVNVIAMTHARSTTIKVGCVIRQIFKYAKKQKIIIRSPLVDEPLEVPRKLEVKRHVPSKEEIGKLLSSLQERSHGEFPLAYVTRIALVTLAVFCGLRRGEICGLKWEYVDFENQTIHVRHSFSSCDGLKEPKTKAGRRSVPMAAPVIAVLRHLRGLAQDTQEFVLVGAYGKPILPHHLGGAYWKPMMARAGLLKLDGTPLFGLHALRHAAVSLMIEQNLGMFHISRMIGHNSIQTTMDIYGGLFPEDQATRSAVNAAASAFDLTRGPTVIASKITRQGCDITI